MDESQMKTIDEAHATFAEWQKEHVKSRKWFSRLLGRGMPSAETAFIDGYMAGALSAINWSYGTILGQLTKGKDQHNGN